MSIIRNLLIFIMGFVLTTSAFAGETVTVGTGFDYSQGDYGLPSNTKTWVIPFYLKYEKGPMTLKATVPWVSTSGRINKDTGVAVTEDLQNPAETDAPGGATILASKKNESGLGDPILFGAYELLHGPDFGIDVGIKAKIAISGNTKPLISTGKNDYSLQTDGYKTFGKITTLATLGWTKKGDPSYTRFRDPWYASLGLSFRIDAKNSVGGFYDYREKVTSSGPPKSELTGFVSHQLTDHWRMQIYGVAGFSNGSPDTGIGGLISHQF